MAELQKVYGYKSNKCKQPVVSHEELVITMCNGEDWDGEEGAFELDYPQGYNKSNTIIVDATVYKATSIDGRYTKQDVSAVELDTDSIWVVPDSSYQNIQSVMVSVMVSKGVS